METKAVHKKPVWPARVSAGAALLVCALVAAYLLLNSSAGRAVVFLAFWVYLPGRWLAGLLVKKPGPLVLLFSFYLGLALLFPLFYAGRLLLHAAWPLYLPPVAGVAHAVRRVVLRLRAKTPLRPAALVQSGHFRAVLWLTAMGMCFSLAITALAMRGITEVVNPDYLWHMGNIHTLAHSPGFEDIRVLGMPFRYHYFSDLIWACGRLVLGIDPFDCVLRLPALLAPVLMASGVYALVQTGAQNRALAFGAAAVALFCAPLYGRFNDFSYQWGSNVNAVGVALPCAVLLILFSRALLQRQALGWREWLCGFLLAALAAGLKGPFGVCALACVAGVSLVRLRWRRRFPRRWLWYLASLAAGFFLVWLLLLSKGMNSDYVKTWQPFYSVYTAEVLAPLLVALGNGFWARFLLLPLHILVVLGVFCVPFVAACVRFIHAFVRGVPVDDGRLFLLAGAVAPLLVFYMLDLAGRSQFYFLYFAVPFVAAAAAQEVQAHWLPRLKKGRVRAAGAALACAAVVLFAALHPYYEKGGPSYTPAEVEAARWLAGNVPEGDVIAVNRHGTMYLASAVSGRQFWLEGSSYAKNSGQTEAMLDDQRRLGDALFREGTPGKHRLAQELGIGWLLQYTRGASAELLAAPGEGFTLCWEGDGVRVWKVE